MWLMWFMIFASAYYGWIRPESIELDLKIDTTSSDNFIPMPLAPLNSILLMVSWILSIKFYGSIAITNSSTAPNVLESAVLIELIRISESGNLEWNGGWRHTGVDWEWNRHRSISIHSVPKVIHPTEGFPRLLRHNSMAEGSFGCDYIMAVDCVAKSKKN